MTTKISISTSNVSINADMNADTSGSDDAEESAIDPLLAPYRSRNNFPDCPLLKRLEQFKSLFVARLTLEAKLVLALWVIIDNDNHEQYDNLWSIH